MDPTDPRPEPTWPDPPQRRGTTLSAPALLRHIASAVLLAALLAACAGGSAEEARRERQRDLARPAVLGEAQATRLAEVYFPPTPSPTPPPPPPPALGALVVTLAVGTGNAPQGSYASVPADAGTVYAAARMTELAAGQRIEGIWTDAFGNEVGRSQVDAGGGGGEQWVAFPLRLGGAVPPGEYAIFIDVDGRRLGSLAFTITSPGSGPVALPELPADPQAPAPAQPPPQGQNPPEGEAAPTPPPIEQGGPPTG